MEGPPDQVAPRISIIIPAFNVAAYVGAAIESALAQTSPAYEILLFDDGSTDDTAQLLHEYASSPTVYVFSHANKGPGLTRNIGAQKARGAYLYFLDSDDVMDIHLIERMQELIKKYNAPELIMFSGKSFADADADSLKRSVADSNRRKFYGRPGAYSNISGQKALSLLGQNKHIPGQACLYVTKVAYWRAQRFAFPATLYEDREIIVSLIVKASNIVIRDEVYLYHRKRRDSITTTHYNAAHAAGLESNLRHAIRDLSLVPIPARINRKILRERVCKAALRYINVAHDVRLPIRRRILLHALIRTGKVKIIKRVITLRLRRTNVGLL